MEWWNLIDLFENGGGEEVKRKPSNKKMRCIIDHFASVVIRRLGILGYDRERSLYNIAYWGSLGMICIVTRRERSDSYFLIEKLTELYKPESKTSDQLFL